MIESMRKTSSGILAVILLTIGLTAHAQRRATRNSDRQVAPILQRIETNTHAFHNSLSASLDQLARYYKVSWRSDDWINPQRAGQGGCRESSDGRLSSRSSAQ
jgi:hypothetical protein